MVTFGPGFRVGGGGVLGSGFPSRSLVVGFPPCWGSRSRWLSSSGPGFAVGGLVPLGSLLGSASGVLPWGVVGVLARRWGVVWGLVWGLGCLGSPSASTVWEVEARQFSVRLVHVLMTCHFQWCCLRVSG